MSTNNTFYPIEPGSTLQFDSFVPDLFDNILVLPKNRVLEELKKYGWEKRPLFGKEFLNNVFIDKEGILRNFDLPIKTPINQEVLNRQVQAAIDDTNILNNSNITLWKSATK